MVERTAILAQCYRDFYQSRLNLAELVPLAKHYPILFVGWMTDDQLLSLIPPQEARMQERYMKHSWFKSQVVSKTPSSMQYRTPFFYNIAHPGIYLEHAGSALQKTAIPMVICIDQALAQLGGPAAIPDLAAGKLDHLPLAITLKTWTDELQAFIWGRRIRPSDDNTRTMYAIHNHQLHGSSTPYKQHTIEGKCCCDDCRRHNPVCRCVNCIEHRKMQLLFSHLRLCIQQ